MIKFKNLFHWIMNSSCHKLLLIIFIPFPEFYTIEIILFSYLEFGMFSISVSLLKVTLRYICFRYTWLMFYVYLIRYICSMWHSLLNTLFRIHFCPQHIFWEPQTTSCFLNTRNVLIRNRIDVAFICLNIPKKWVYPRSDKAKIILSV